MSSCGHTRHEFGVPSGDLLLEPEGDQKADRCGWNDAVNVWEPCWSEPSAAPAPDNKTRNTTTPGPYAPFTSPQHGVESAVLPAAPVAPPAEALAELLAHMRTKGAVRMDGSHNPLPSEVTAARMFIEDHWPVAAGGRGLVDESPSRPSDAPMVPADGEAPDERDEREMASWQAELDRERAKAELGADGEALPAEEHIVDAVTGECVEHCPCQPAESWPAAGAGAAPSEDALIERLRAPNEKSWGLANEAADRLEWLIGALHGAASERADNEAALAAVRAEPAEAQAQTRTMAGIAAEHVHRLTVERNALADRIAAVRALPMHDEGTDENADLGAEGWNDALRAVWRTLGSSPKGRDQ